MFPFDFQVTWSKVKVKLLVFCEKTLSARYLLIPLQHSPLCRSWGLEYRLRKTQVAITGSDSSTAECPATIVSVTGPWR